MIVLYIIISFFFFFSENIFPKFDKILKVSLEICDNLVKLNNQQKIKKDIVQNDSNIIIDEDNAL